MCSVVAPRLTRSVARAPVGYLARLPGNLFSSINDLPFTGSFMSEGLCVMRVISRGECVFGRAYEISLCFKKGDYVPLCEQWHPGYWKGYKLDMHMSYLSW